MTASPEHADRQSRYPRALTGAVVGLLAAAVAIGAGQFASGLGVPQSSPVLAVGEAAIDLTPLPVKDFAISAFGANDKTVLLGGILVILAGYAAVVGMLAVRRLAFGMAGLAVFACIGVAAALSRPTADPGYVVPTLVGAAAGAVALAWARPAAWARAVPSCWLRLTCPRRTSQLRACGRWSARARLTPSPARLIRAPRGHPGGPRGGGS
jgi:hypothetical protein